MGVGIGMVEGILRSHVVAMGAGVGVVRGVLAAVLVIMVLVGIVLVVRMVIVRDRCGDEKVT